MSTELYNEIKHHMALAFFASAYADQAEECGQALRGEIMDQLPEEIDPAAEHAACMLIHDMQLLSKLGVQPNGIEKLYEQAVSLWDGDREPTPEMFGHYCAMQAMGHGVGLDDAFGSAAYDAIYVPYTEFGSHSLQKDYFTEAGGIKHGTVHCYWLSRVHTRDFQPLRGS